MNELMVRRYMKQVMGYGIPKMMAQEIVHTAMEVSKGNDLDRAINYAIDLTYGLGFTNKFATK